MLRGFFKHFIIKLLSPVVLFGYLMSVSAQQAHINQIKTFLKLVKILYKPAKFDAYVVAVLLLFYEPLQPEAKQEEICGTEIRIKHFKLLYLLSYACRLELSYVHIYFLVKRNESVDLVKPGINELKGNHVVVLRIKKDKVYIIFGKMLRIILPLFLKLGLLRYYLPAGPRDKDMRHEIYEERITAVL